MSHYNTRELHPSETSKPSVSPAASFQDISGRQSSLAPPSAPLSEASAEVEGHLLDQKAGHRQIQMQMKETIDRRSTSDDIQNKAMANYKPYEDLFKTPVKLEYGQGDQEFYMVHREILGCYSRSVEDAFREAEPLRQQHASASAIWDRLKVVLTAELSSESFLLEENQKETLRLVHQCFREYPVPTYQRHIRDELMRFSDSSLFPHNTKLDGPQAVAAVKKANFRDKSFVERCRLLNSKGVKSLCMHLCMTLREIQVDEIKDALESPVRAAALGRIIVRGATQKATRSVIHWIYKNELLFEDAVHLCQMYKVANFLEINELSEIIVSELYTETRTALDEAMLSGCSLASLLQCPQTDNCGRQPNHAKPNFVHTVFTFVISEEDPPDVLRSLVIETLSNKCNADAFKFFRKKMRLDLALRIIDTLLPQTNPTEGRELLKHEH